MAKKAAKKKKKAAKKSNKKNSDGPNKKGVTIVLKDNALPDPKDAEVSKSAKDRVRWDNESSRGRTIKFDHNWWPFEEPPVDIVVEAGKKSKWFHVSSSAPSSGYDYDVSPPLVAGTGPDEPKISVGE